MEVDTIYNMNCLDGMRELPDDVIDMTICSPPFGDIRSYDGLSVWDWSIFAQFAPELYRVMKPGGMVVWIVNDQTVKGSETGTSFKQVLKFKECGFDEAMGVVVA
jgi:site-specific DNA-methyltransferase (adenine-specific)